MTFKYKNVYLNETATITGPYEEKGPLSKYYDKSFDTQYLRFPYVGQWKKVEFQGKPGYMKYYALSESKLM